MMSYSDEIYDKLPNIFIVSQCMIKSIGSQIVSVN